MNQVATRIRQELKQVGVTTFGRAKFASHYLPHILHEDEHIKGAVYGRYNEGTSMLGLVEGMLIATDRRVIFLDRKPGFEAMDEFTYDIVSGIQKSYAWPFASITLYTRIANYTLRYANQKCIDIFMHYIEQRRLESINGTSQNAAPPVLPIHIDDQTIRFLRRHQTGVLSTVDRSGKVYGAAVHYQFTDEKALYVLTKTETQKARNIFATQQAALTLYDQAVMQTVQIQGTAWLEQDQATRDNLFTLLSGPRVYGEQQKLPPVTQLIHGAYVVLKIIPSAIHLSDFSLGHSERSHLVENLTS